MDSNASSSLTVGDLLYLERFVNVGTRTYSKMSNYTELPRKYRPETEESSSFEIPLIRLPRQCVECTVANPSAALQKYFMHENEKTVSFAVHPVVFEVSENDQPPWLNLVKKAQARFKTPVVCVAPFASSRSLLALDPEGDTKRHLPPFVIKCHCPVRISRYIRDLGPQTIRHSVLMSHELERSGIPILPETLGISLPAVRGGKCGWGFIVREMTPRPAILGCRTQLIPCFSLYGRDVHDIEGDPLLVKLIRHQSKKHAADYILDYIMLPIIRNFCSTFLRSGILLEAHGQNILLEIDASTCEPLRVVHRDFDLVLDSRIRTGRGLQMESFVEAELESGYSEHSESGWLSMIYDSSIGHHHFDYLADLARDYFGVKKTFLQEQCQKAFAEAFPNSLDYFPNDVHYYADTAIERDNYPVVSTGKKPVWRPS